MDRTDICPVCGTDNTGDPIPEDSRKYYGENVTHFSKVIGVEYPGGYDGISEWNYPCCGARVGRWSGRVLEGELDLELRYGQNAWGFGANP